MFFFGTNTLLRNWRTSGRISGISIIKDRLRDLVPVGFDYVLVITSKYEFDNHSYATEEFVVGHLLLLIWNFNKSLIIGKFSSWFYVIVHFRMRFYVTFLWLFTLSFLSLIMILFFDDFFVIGCHWISVFIDRYLLVLFLTCLAVQKDGYQSNHVRVCGLFSFCLLDATFSSGQQPF